MDKILVVGEKDGFARLVLAELFDRYEVCSCEFQAISRTIRIQKPKVMLHFKNMTTMTRVYAETKNDYPEMGIVVICEPDDDSLARNHIPGMIAVNRPVSVSKVMECIETVLTQAQPEEKRKSILAVDDNTMVLRTIKDTLGKSYDISFAPSGVKALDLLKNKEFDLILLDYEMPEMSGYDVLKKIRSTPAIQDIPVVFLTGVADKSKIVDVIALNPAGYLLKPLDLEKIQNTVKEIIGI